MTPLFNVPGIRDPRISGMVVVQSGTPTYTVEYTLDGTYFLPLTADLTSITSSNDFTVVFPVKGIRVNFTAGTGELILILRYDDGGFE
jgi:hypothetical protein